MKKLISIAFISICSVALAETPVQLSLGISVDVSRIQFEGLSYTPASVVTNSLTTWVSAIEVRTNLYYGMQPDEVVTNAVQKQVTSVTVVTNAARWTTSFDYSIPAGTVLLIGDSLSASPVRRADLTVQMDLTSAQMTAILGSTMYAKTLTAAQLFGTLPVSGSMAEALRAAVQSVLASAGSGQ